MFIASAIACRDNDPEAEYAGDPSMASTAFSSIFLPLTIPPMPRPKAPTPGSERPIFLKYSRTNLSISKAEAMALAGLAERPLAPRACRICSPTPPLANNASFSAPFDPPNPSGWFAIIFSSLFPAPDGM